ncbi:MAG TPA: hypothetical protein VMY78_06930 [Solirubrobacteraceae bacterium]|nr:hypothetical protein [Solirubrobacteraceae bacterium]
MGASSGPDGRPRATRWEIIGHRLRIWTPPRDVEIPPVDKRVVGIWLAAIAAAVAVVEQRARRARSTTAARLHATGDDDAARAALLADVRTRVGNDAGARVAAGKLDGPIRDVRCKYRPRGGDVGVRVQLDCLAVTSVIGDAAKPKGYIGHPFVAAGSLRDGRYAWCKENPPPGEGFAGRNVAVALAPECLR